jgi:glycosyltransferase involved in cell wall biosynthesis
MDASIIIPARNAAKLLDATLAALKHQQTDRSFEVIVVDDDSGDATPQVCQNRHATSVLMPRSSGDKIRKAAEARNLGASHSQGELLIFLDADMIPRSDFVRRHIEAHRSRSVVLGIRHETTISGELIQYDPRDPYFLVCDNDLSRTASPWFLLHSHNFSVSRSDFDAVRGFSTYFSVWGAEDQELGYKLWKDGCTLILDRTIVAGHQYHPPEYRSGIEKKVNLIRNASRFYEEYHDETISRLFGLDKKLIVLRLDAGCNNHCADCTQEEGIHFLGSTEALRQTIARVPTDWKIILSGKEPTISPALFSLADTLKGRSIELETNGRALSYQSFCKECVAHGITDYLVHVFGHTSNLHDRATGIKGSFDQTLKGIDNALLLGQGVGVRICITENNSAAVMDMVSYYRGRNLPVQISFGSVARRALEPVIRNCQQLSTLGVTFTDAFMRCILYGNDRPLDIRGCSHCKLINVCRGRVEELAHAYA